MGVPLLIGLMLATLVVLVAGIGVMARGGEASRKHSNRIMIARVSLQALTILLFVVLMLTHR